MLLYPLFSYQYSKLFDPRVERAALSSGSSSAQPEHVTGTHLYAYLMDETPTFTTAE